MAENDFQNKRVCVTGAGRGIGKSLALRLAELGAQVIAVSKSDENLKQLVAEVCQNKIFTNYYLFIFFSSVRIIV